MKILKKNKIPRPTLYCLILILSLSVQKVVAQDIIFSQFYANPLYLNPAFAGTKECTKLRLHYRNQPFPTFGTYSTYNVNAETYSEYLSSGFGFQVIHDNQGGLLQSNIIGASYAYHLRLSRIWKASLGLEAAYYHTGIQHSALVFPDQYNYQDVSEPHTSSETIQLADIHSPDFSAGFLVFKHNFYGGFSVKHLTQARINDTGKYFTEIKHSLQAGYTIKSQQGRRRHRNIQENELSLHFIAENQAQYTRFNYGLYWGTHNLKLGGWFRQNLFHPNAIIFMVGLRQNNYQIAYSYDYSLSGLSGLSGGAHEVSVLLKFNCRTQNNRYQILNCPTF